MILFLDTVSSLPEFSIIEDNKIIYSQGILTNDNLKISDCIISAYLLIEKKFLIKKKLKLLIINTGPGSYTALRVGIAFFAGLSLSKEVDLLGVDCISLFRYVIKDCDLISSAIYISSSNNQNFFCQFNDKKKLFDISKLEKNTNIDNLINGDVNLITTIYSNVDDYITKNFNKKIKKIKFDELVNTYLDKIILLPKKEIIEPIYFSTNKLLN